jgi:ferric-dicitrate binding protein FerR (iron transport regulator)
MKSNRPLSEIAAKVLAREASQPAKTSPENRAAAIAAIARTINEQKRRQRLKWRAGAGMFAVAASIALVVGITRGNHQPAVVVTTSPSASTAPIATAAASFVRGSPLVVRGGAHRPVFDGTLLENGDRLIVDPSSRTAIAFSNGTYLLVEERSDLVLVSAAPEMTFELDSGSVHADVARLKANERFVIRTSDAEIEVHGTSFDVTRVASDPSCGGGTTTRVRVREGTVAVRAGGKETFVHAGDAWPRCDSTTEAPMMPPTPPSATAVRRKPEPPASDLAAQNDQFEKAVARKRANDVPGAIAAFDEFLAKYPGSHLVQSARAERMKLLRSVDRDRARAAAKSYLDAYPNGFARHDAELILSSRP